MHMVKPYKNEVLITFKIVFTVIVQRRKLQIRIYWSSLSEQFALGPNPLCDTNKMQIHNLVCFFFLSLFIS